MKGRGTACGKHTGNNRVTYCRIYIVENIVKGTADEYRYIYIYIYCEEVVDGKCRTYCGTYCIVKRIVNHIII